MLECECGEEEARGCFEEVDVVWEEGEEYGVISSGGSWGEGEGIRRVGLTTDRQNASSMRTKLIF